MDKLMEKFFLERDAALLVVVDLQERLAVVMEERHTVVANTLHLIEAAKLLSIPIMLTEQYPKGLGRTVSEVRDALPSHEAIEKIAFGCCGEPRFQNTLVSFGRRKVIVCGMETHVCVLQTCLGLLRDSYLVHVVTDAMCSRTKENHKTGIQFMRDAGAVITGTETVLFQLLEKAGTEEFRAISKRIK